VRIFTGFPQAGRRKKNLSLDADLLKKIEGWCGLNGYTVSEITDQLFALFLSQLDQGQGVARALRFDDLIDQKIDDQCTTARSVENRSVENPTSEAKQNQKPVSKTEIENPEWARATEILELYRQLSGNRIRHHDRIAVKQVFKFPDVLIFAGIMRAALGCAERVGSFAYCVKVIEQLAAAEVDQVAEFERLREKLLTRARGGQLVLPLSTERLLFGDFSRGAQK
jgi:hypothetical protein